MQVLYVLDFDVEREGGDSAAAYEALRDHLAGWIAGPDATGVSVNDLRRSGEADLPVDAAHLATRAPRRASWSVAGTDEVEALRLDVRTPLAGGSANFVARCTISRRPGPQARMRLALGREVATGWLAPATFATLRRPGLVRNVLMDESLRVCTLGQAVDGRYERLYTRDEVAAVVDAVESQTRLPLLVIRPRADTAWNLARRVSNELAGLAQVVCLASWDAYSKFNETMRSVAVPDGGGRLIWPDLDGSRHPDFVQAVLEDDDPSHLTGRLMRMLAPLSVAARGRDTGWEEAQQAVRRRDAALAAERLAEARAAGDQQAEVQALSDQNAALRSELDEWLADHEAQDQDLADLRARISETERAAFEGQQWKRQYFDLLSSKGTSSGVDWSAAPDLEPSNAQPLFDFLETATEGRCVFTANAAKVWRKSGYPFPEAMRETLIAIAKSAVHFTEDQGEINARLTDWFKDHHGLNVAMSDQELERRGLADFTFEGETLSRVPHVMLDDHTKPDRVGRIYFAVESNPPRFVLDHVGLKLYGL